jgi:hypothetical protein
VAPLAELIRADLQQTATAPLLTLLFGTTDAQDVADAIETWVAEELDSAIADAWLWRAGVGAVAGLRLRDRSRVAVKVHQPERTEARLLDVQRAQRRAWSAGIAVPQPIGAPAPLGSTLATAETAMLEGRIPNLRNVRDRRTAAHGLARLIEALRSLRDDVPAIPVVDRPPALYPDPHSPLFAFDATAAGAEWIDDLARQARAVIDEDASPYALVHTDWRADNLRVAKLGRHVTAVYDWDSLRVDREARALGQVAAMHSVDLSGPKPPHYATAAECVAFAEEVASAMPRGFTATEQRTARAAILYSWCYTARCEHARAAVGDNHPWFGMRHRLRADAAQLL